MLIFFNTQKNIPDINVLVLRIYMCLAISINELRKEGPISSEIMFCFLIKCENGHQILSNYILKIRFYKI
jgi:hypothetical protein